MLGNSHFDGLLAEASSRQAATKVDWAGVQAAMADNGIQPDSVAGLSWCTFGTRNIEANIDPPGLAIVAPAGVLVTAGKRGMMSKAVKAWTISASQCRQFGPADWQDERGYGKFCIEFAGPGSVPLGRLEWRWTGKRFRDNRQEIMAIAEERDRILGVVGQVMGG